MFYNNFSLKFFVGVLSSWIRNRPTHHLWRLLNGLLHFFFSSLLFIKVLSAAFIAKFWEFRVDIDIVSAYIL